MNFQSIFCSHFLYETLTLGRLSAFFYEKNLNFLSVSLWILGNFTPLTHKFLIIIIIFVWENLVKTYKILSDFGELMRLSIRLIYCLFCCGCMKEIRCFSMKMDENKNFWCFGWFFGYWNEVVFFVKNLFSYYKKISTEIIGSKFFKILHKIRLFTSNLPNFGYNLVF